MSVILGVDEVGRGCLAGPVAAGAVILGSPISDLKDSKLLSKSARESLTKIIQQSALSWNVGWASVEEINELGLTAAVQLAMQRAVAGVDHDYEQLIVDGNYNYFRENPKAMAVVRADQTVPVVSAASILAKVARDGYMTQQAEIYPGYGFEQHVGYGTKLHMESLARLGVSKIHRLRFKPVAALLQ